MAKVSASNFRDPLLKVMGEITSYQAGVDVSFSDTIEPVLRELGFSEDQFGTDSLDRPQTHVWINQAFNKKLRPEGMGDKGSKKGFWTLTSQGVRAALLLAGKAPVEEAPAEETPVSDETPAQEEAAVVPSASAHPVSGGVSFSLGGQTNTYNPDPYIRGLAINQTACFGSFYDRSKVCQTCPLSGSCKASTLKNLANIAARLRAGEDPATTEDTTEDTTTGPDMDLEEILEAIEGGAAAMKRGNAQRMDSIPATTTCSTCSKNIEAGSPAYWVKGNGMHHIECWESP